MSVPGLSLLGLKCIRGFVSILRSINPTTIFIIIIKSKIVKTMEPTRDTACVQCLHVQVYRSEYFLKHLAWLWHLSSCQQIALVRISKYYCWAPARGREQLELFLAPTRGSELWQYISRCLPQLVPASWRKEQLELFPAASWRLTLTVYQFSFLFSTRSTMPAPQIQNWLHLAKGEEWHY